MFEISDLMALLSVHCKSVFPCVCVCSNVHACKHRRHSHRSFTDSLDSSLYHNCRHCKWQRLWFFFYF